MEPSWKNFHTDLASAIIEAELGYSFLCCILNTAFTRMQNDPNLRWPLPKIRTCLPRENVFIHI
jgi:hypothetical protein